MTQIIFHKILLLCERNAYTTRELEMSTTSQRTQNIRRTYEFLAYYVRLQSSAIRNMF